MSVLFVDTSAFVALASRRDRNHGSAKACLRSASRKKRPLVMTDYIVDETITLVRRRMGLRSAVKLGDALFRSEWCRRLDLGEDLRVAAWQLFVRFDDQLFSFTGCTSFALMESMGLTEAFTYDRGDFEAAGFVAVG